MGESSSNVVNSFLECSICLQNFEDPKLLRCAHHFCKQCLEGIIVFRKDGAGSITCPMRCKEKTNINKDQTISDLSASYELKGILDAMQASSRVSEEPPPSCNYKENCPKPLTSYCCKFLMCTSCHSEHYQSGNCSSDRITINFSRKENCLKLFCETHRSQCTHICCEDTYMCIYCMARDKVHKTHAKETISSVAAEMKRSLLERSKHLPDARQYRNATEKAVTEVKRNLEVLLKKRKRKCLALYRDFLDLHEDKVKKDLDNFCNRHLGQYSRFTPQYYLDLLDRSDAELIIEKEEGEFDDESDKDEGSFMLNCDRVTMRNDFDFKSERPLGDLDFLKTTKEVNANGIPFATIEDEFIIPEENESGTESKEVMKAELESEGDHGSEIPSKKKRKLQEISNEFYASKKEIFEVKSKNDDDCGEVKLEKTSCDRKMVSSQGPSSGVNNKPCFDIADFFLNSFDEKDRFHERAPGPSNIKIQTKEEKDNPATPPKLTVTPQKSPSKNKNGENLSSSEELFDITHWLD